METTNNEMTAERSLEIIRKNIEESRRRITQGSWKSMMLWGISVVVIALVVGHFWAHGIGPAANGLWGLLGITYLIDYKVLTPRPKLPETFVSKTLSQIWSSFGIMAGTIGFGMGMLAMLNVKVALPTFMSDDYLRGLTHVSITSLIILLMGIAGMITGRILKSRVITVSCFVSGLLGSFLALVYAGPLEMLVMAGAAVIGLIVPAVVIKMKED